MSKLRRSAGGAHTLEAEYYVSPDIYRRETETIFRQRWLYAGRLEGLTEPGSFLLADMGGEQLIVLRDRQQQLRAHHNVCRHRGTRLCESPRGCFSNTIQCPYHGWTYDLEGKLIGAPNMPQDFDRRPYALHSACVDVWQGLLFLNSSRGAQSLQRALAAVWDRFGAWRLGELQVVQERVYDVEANWKLVFQNYSECYHCPTLHPHLNRLTPYRESSNDLEEGPILGGPMQLKDPAGSMTVDGKPCAAPLNPEGRGRAYYYTILPNCFLSLFPDYVLIHRLERRSPSTTRVTCEWLFAPEAVCEPKFDPQPAVDFWDLTNRQDWHICEQAQQGIASSAYSPGPYADLESMLAAFDREYLAALGNPKP